MGVHVRESPHVATEPTAQEVAVAGQDSRPFVHGKWQLPTGNVPVEALQVTPGPTVPGAKSAPDCVHVKDASTSPSFGTVE
jgi:hypothetical protein